MAPIITETSQMIFVAMREEINVPGLVLLSVLEVVDANIRVGDVTHCVLCVWLRPSRNCTRMLLLCALVVWLGDPFVTAWAC